MTDPLLKIEDVSVEFPAHKGVMRALDHVNVEAGKGKTMAIVGESGCGKTTLARVVLGLQPTVSGSVTLNDDLAVLPDTILAQRIGMVWQDPFASLDPRWSIGRIIEEPLKLAGADGDVTQILKSVGLTPAMADRFPHQLSGGQRQRAAIGRAIALRPPLVICDEPTAALDLSIQAQILNLLQDMQQDLGCTYLYISHDLATVRFIADEMTVMYFGKVVEQGNAANIFDDPQHAYTQRLLRSVVTIDSLGRLPDVEEQDETEEALTV
jgi:ABC-type glutathione transport system ATPase component